MEPFVKIWSEGCVPQEWKVALIVPIPKKGGPSVCDNWRGIGGGFGGSHGEASG